MSGDEAQLQGVIDMCSSSSAFAALREDGSVLLGTWLVTLHSFGLRRSQLQKMYEHDRTCGM